MDEQSPQTSGHPIQMSSKNNSKRSASSKSSSGSERSKMKQTSLNGSKQVAPVSKTTVRQTSRPQMQSSRNGDCRIKHREYIGDIVGAAGSPSAYSIASYPINPGLVAFSPWLATIAQRFESYRFHSLKFIYETEAPSSLGGTLLLSADYDAADSPPSSKVQLMSYRSSVRSAPWCDVSFVALKEDLQKLPSRYVRTAALAANLDIKTYDVGNFFAATQNVTSPNAVCGELYVEYDVELMTPVYDAGNDVAGGSVAGGGALSAASVLGSAPVPDPANAGVSFSGNTITFAVPGTYLFNGTISGTVITGFGNGSSSGGSLVGINASINAAGTTANLSSAFITTAANATFTFSCTATTVTSSAMRVGVSPAGSQS